MKTLDSLSFTGRHVRLEPLLQAHAQPLLDAANESRGTFGLTLVPSNRAGMDAYIAKALSELERGQSIPFVVRDGTGEIVGSTRFMCIEWWEWPGEPAAPLPNGPDAVEIGCTWYAERVQRTALNTEAKLLLCTHAFEEWRVRRVTWKTDERNARSRAAIQRLGASFDGVLRANRAGFDGLVRSTAYYSMLANEWPSARRALAARLERRRELDLRPA